MGHRPDVIVFGQLGLSPALVAVADVDDEGASLLEQAERDGINVSAVIRGHGPGLIAGLARPWDIRGGASLTPDTLARQFKIQQESGRKAQ
jgi:hypothetical protein